jgi:hypothetical protein
MSRPLSSDVLYPFVPGTPNDNYIKGIKDIILVAHSTPSSIVSVSGSISPFASLISNGDNGTLLFSIFTPSTIPGDFEKRDITFHISETEGFGSVKSSDGYSTLFVSFSEMIIPSSSVTHGNMDYVVEPCNIRLLQSAATTITLVNEQRLSDPTARTDLDNTIIRVFNAYDPMRLNNGYNVDLKERGNDLDILGRAGAGKGKAPNNMWEDIAPPVALTPVKTINGQPPQPDGDFLIDRSSSIGISSDSNLITVLDNSMG